MKKYISVFLVIAVVLAQFCVLVQAVEYEDTNKIFVHNLSYSESELKPGSLSVTCQLEKIKKVGNSQKYAFFTVVRQRGKIVSYDIKEGYLSAWVMPDLTNTVTIPSDTVRVTVETYFWNSLKEAKSIAPKAVFKSSDNTIRDIYIDGVKKTDFDGSKNEYVVEFPASTLHTPKIAVVPNDLSSEITVDEIVSLPQDVKVSVKAHNGNVKEYLIKLKLKSGSVSDVYMKEGSERVTIPCVEMIKPDYGNLLAPGDDGFMWDKNFPNKKTPTYVDRPDQHYVYDWEGFINQNPMIVQLNKNIFYYNEEYLDKTNKDAVLGGFKIDRSADIYVAQVGQTYWSVVDGYEKTTDASLSIYLEGRANSDQPYKIPLYKKRVIVPEGQTANIRIGGSLNESDTKIQHYFMLVDFLTPDMISGVKNVKLNGVSDFVFDENVTEYNITLSEGTTVIPELTYDLVGVGTTATVEKAASLPGKTTLKVSSKDGSQIKTYTFNLKLFANDLKELKVGGINVAGFDKDVYDYEYLLKHDWTVDKGFPEVTAVAEDGVTVTKTDADELSMETEIKLSSPYAADKYYRIKFKVRESAPTGDTSKAEISSILLDGKAINLNRMNTETKTYKEYLPYGTTSYPIVSVSVNEADAPDVYITQANGETNKATVKVISYDTLTTNTYTVEFVIYDKESQSSSRTLKYADASTVSGANVSAGLNAGSMNSNLKYIQFGNIMGTENGYSDKVALMELDLNKIKDEIDKSKSITISTNAKLRAHYVFSGDIAIYESKKQVSQITELAQLSDIDSIIDINNPISETKVTMDSAGYTSATWDITEFVIECLEKGIYKPVIAFYVPDGFATTDLTQRSQFTIYIQNAADSSLNYYKLSM